MTPTLALVALLALAAPPGGGAPGQARFAAGRTAYEEGDFDRALVELEAAAAQVAGSDQVNERMLVRIHLLRGQCYAAMSDNERAEEAFTDVMEYDPEVKMDPSKVRPAIVDMFEMLRTRTTAELKVRANETNVLVFVDGKQVGTAPVKLMVPVGKRVVEAKTVDGAMSHTEEVMIYARQSHELKLRLSPATAPEPKAKPTRDSDEKPEKAPAPKEKKLRPSDPPDED